MEDPTPITDISLPTTTNSRYPRPKWLRTLRSLLSEFPWWLIPIEVFLLYIVVALYRLAVANGLGTLLNISTDVTQLNPMTHPDTGITMLVLIALLTPPVVFLRRWAQKDEKQEDETKWQDADDYLWEVDEEAIEREKQPPPLGITLRHTLRGHEEVIYTIAWSPDGRFLACSSTDRIIQIWDAHTGQHLRILKGFNGTARCLAWSPDGNTLASGHGEYDAPNATSMDAAIRLWDTYTWQLLNMFTGHTDVIRSVTWSPDGQLLASGGRDKTIKIWNTDTGQLLHTFKGHSDWIFHLAWSPNRQLLASASGDKTIRIWNIQTGQSQVLTGHTQPPYCVIWSPHGSTLVSSSADNTIRVWDVQSGQQQRVLEGHTGLVTQLSSSSSGRLLASKSDDNTVRIWRTDIWDCIAILNEAYPTWVWSSLAFHPGLPILATTGEGGKSIRIWDLDVDTLLNPSTTSFSVSYTNAKVVLLGDSGVGKSGLGLVLSGEPFALTESTHARRVWTFEQEEAKLENGRKETRETLLWDLAGQPGYRLIHQLYLNEVTVALVVFDARSETDPFAGVQHWERALSQAQRVQGKSALPLKKFLVQARCDRGGIGVSSERVQSLLDELGFDGYFETSAKEGWHIDDLREAIHQAIDWNSLPKVTSTLLFQQIKEFLLTEKEAGRLISTEDDLYHTFLKSDKAPTDETENLLAQFETCIGRVESAGLIKRLSFGKLVLLQPELLDTYASALVNAVKDEPDGLGSITEERVRSANFRMPQDERIKDREQEKLLLIAMVEDLLRRELVLREEPFLVFPSQSTRKNPNLPDPQGKTVVFDFEGPVLNIYATLAVRLSYSGLFKRKELWKNAITYTANVGGTCGMFLRNIGEGRGSLTLFFDKAASEETRFNFEQYVQIHLQRRALQESLERRRLFTCDVCGFQVTEQLLHIRDKRGFNWLDCPGCDTRITLLDREQRLATMPPSRIVEMDRAADSQRDREAAKSTVQGKQETKDFDVFLCHHGIDKPAVKRIGEQLKEHGLLPWLDEWELRPGLPWQRVLENQIEHIKSAAVFVGRSGLGPWQQHELEAFLREFVDRDCPVIPVLLPDAPKEPQLPVFLRGMTWVDFRQPDPDPMQRLIWGITGDRMMTH